MKTTTTIAVSLLTVSLLSAAETNTNDHVKNAVTKLKQQPNYSWTTKLDLPGMPFTPAPQHGKVDKDGIAIVTQEFSGNTVQAAFKAGKVAVFVDDEWQLVSNPNSGDFGDRAAMTARWLARAGTAADEASDLLGKAQALKAGEDGVLSGDLTEKGVTDLLSFGPRRGAGSAASPVKNAKGSIKFWLKDGALVKFESHLHGAVPFGPDQEERDVDVTRTVEIREVGKTKVEIPEAARKKLAGE